jgi:hypothetical protein
MFYVVFDEYDNEGNSVGIGLRYSFNTIEEAERFAESIEKDPLCERVNIEVEDY